MLCSMPGAGSEIVHAGPYCSKFSVISCFLLTQLK